MLRVFLFSLALLVALPLSAGGPRAVRKQAESSLRVTGFVVIGTDGTVQGHELDPKAPLTPTLVEFIGRSLDRWCFEPVRVNGEVVRARVPMSLRLVAKRSEDDKYNISITSTHFGSRESSQATDWPQRLEMKPPQFPTGALRAGGKGTAYLIVQIGRDGRVMNVDAEQVNLRVAGSTNQMDQLRKQFAQAAIHAARGWTFAPPTTGRNAEKDSWLVRVPVDFRLVGEQTVQPGEWESYIPGPRNMNMSWAQAQLKLAGNPDALPDSGVFPLEEGAKLLTPPAP